MNVLLVGSGGREHALAWALSSSPLCGNLYCIPGNAGIAQLARCCDVDIHDHGAVIDLIKLNDIDFVMVGPEAPLVDGLVDSLQDSLQNEGIAVFGPDAQGAALEGSKGFMKDFLDRFGIPTAQFKRFRCPDEAKAWIEKKGAPIVVKTDGLAQGKGVYVCQTTQQAFEAVDHMMVDQCFGQAGEEIIIEEFLQGQEVSFFALCDGEDYVSFGGAQDHKAVGEGDTGPNTGGMGAYGPVDILSPLLKEKIEKTVIEPTLKGLKSQGIHYRGVLFAGLMIDENDHVKVLEYNVRFGDPECQVILRLLESDLLQILYQATQGRLNQVKLQWRDDSCVVVVMAAKGYPGSYEKGTPIKGLDEAEKKVPGVKIFHAGTLEKNGQILSNGGRVLAVSATAGTFSQAQSRAYQAVDLIDWPQGFCRRDIGWRELERLKKKLK